MTNDFPAASTDAICPAAVAMGAPGAGAAAIATGASNINATKPVPMVFVMRDLLHSCARHHRTPVPRASRV
jgi:TctA family transporter